MSALGTSKIPYVPESAPSMPRFLVLDIVRLAQHPNLVADGSAGKLGVVTCIRAYDDGSFRYVVSNTDDTDDSDVAGIYYEEMLAATGERCAPEMFALPAGFQVRDVAMVAIDCPRSPQGRWLGRARRHHFAGRTVVIRGNDYVDRHGRVVLGVWCEELAEYDLVPVSFLTRTGERLPPRPLGERTESTRVSQEGKVLGTSSYRLIDDLDHYL
jgi:hypothetical protein